MRDFIRLWIEQLQHSGSLPEEFSARDRGNRLISISPNFLSLLLEVEATYRKMRTNLIVPEAKIVSEVNVYNFFDNPSVKYLNLAMFRYIRMRAYFNADKCAKEYLAQKRKIRKSNAIRKQLKSHA